MTDKFKQCEYCNKTLMEFEIHNCPKQKDAVVRIHLERIEHLQKANEMLQSRINELEIQVTDRGNNYKRIYSQWNKAVIKNAELVLQIDRLRTALAE